MGREDPQLKLRLSEEMKDKVTAAAKANGRSANAEIVARLEQTFDGGTNLTDKQLRALQGLAESYALRQAKFKIDVSHAIGTMREVVKLLKTLRNSPEHHQQAIIAGQFSIESAATYLGRPFGYAPLKNNLFSEGPPPSDPLDEVIAVAEWVTDLLSNEYKRAKDLGDERPQA